MLLINRNCFIKFLFLLHKWKFWLDSSKIDSHFHSIYIFIVTQQGRIELKTCNLFILRNLQISLCKNYYFFLRQSILIIFILEKIDRISFDSFKLLFFFFYVNEKIDQISFDNVNRNPFSSLFLNHLPSLPNPTNRHNRLYFNPTHD